MVDFKVEMDVTVPAMDADIMAIFPGAVTDRFDGTPITIKRITVTQVIYQDRLVREPGWDRRIKEQ